MDVVGPDDLPCGGGGEIGDVGMAVDGGELLGGFGEIGAEPRAMDGLQHTVAEIALNCVPRDDVPHKLVRVERDGENLLGVVEPKALFVERHLTARLSGELTSVPP